MREKQIAPNRPNGVSIEDLSRGRCWRIASVQPARLHRDRSAYPRHLRGRRGIYAWYADTRAQAVLRGTGLEVRHGLVYVGMTRKKGRTFRKRLRQHIRGAGDADLRRKLSWVLYANPDPAGTDLDEFMREHFTARTLPMRVRPHPGEESISDAERRLIEKAKPCLNRKGLDTPNVRRLRELRADAEAAGAAGAEEPMGVSELFRHPVQAVQRMISPTPTSTIEGGNRAERPKDDEDEPVPAPSRPLSALGRFRRDFWTHCSRLHPEIAPTGWAASNVRHQVGTTGRRFSLYVAQDGVGVFFPRQRGETFAARAAAVRPTVDWLRAETGAEMSDMGWSFLTLDSRAKRNWDRMADWLHDHRQLYERALRETGRLRGDESRSV